MACGVDIRLNGGYRTRYGTMGNVHFFRCGEGRGGGGERKEGRKREKVGKRRGKRGEGKDDGKDEGKDEGKGEWKGEGKGEEKKGQ